MARYDGGRGGYRRPGYDASLRGGRQWSDVQRGAMHGDSFADRTDGYDDFGARRGWSEPAEASRVGIYGPARYGLGPYYRRLLDRRRPDDELREEVEEALFYDTWVDAEAVGVEVDDGVVTLRGELPSYEEIRYAIDDAWDVDGVRGVRSELAVARGRQPS